MSRAGRLVLFAAVPALGLSLTACSKTIAQGELEDRVTSAIQSELGVAPEVSCPGDLAAEVDATTECRATDPDTGEEIGLKITVTAVENGTANFDVAPAE